MVMSFPIASSIAEELIYRVWAEVVSKRSSWRLTAWPSVHPPAPSIFLKHEWWRGWVQETIITPSRHKIYAAMVLDMLSETLFASLLAVFLFLDIVETGDAVFSGGALEVYYLLLLVAGN